MPVKAYGVCWSLQTEQISWAGSPGVFFGYVNFLYKRTLERKLPGNAIEMLIDIYDFQIFSKARKF